jgi:CelD/BcsL family acetyltransferase involved in cellulose biosynthesis
VNCVPRRIPTVQTIATFEQLRSIEAEWSSLLLRCSSATPFHSPEWLLPWWKHLFRGGRMWTLAVRNHDRLVGLAPMFIHGLAGEPRQVSFIGSGVTDYTSFLVEDADAARQIWMSIAAASSSWDACDFQEIPPDSPMLSVPGLGLDVQRHTSSACPALRLPASMEQLESQLSRKFRHNLRNARNRLDRLGARFETPPEEQDQEYIEALFRLHAARWASKGEPGVLSSRAIEGFLRDVCAGFRRRGWLRFYGLRLQEELAAVVCNLCALGESAYYIGGFDPAFRRYSPGLALIDFAIESAIKEGCTWFDFMRNTEKYKFDWCAEDRINTRLLMCRRDAGSESESSALDR